MEQVEQEEKGARERGEEPGAFVERSRAVSKKVSLQMVAHKQRGNYTAQRLSQCEPACRTSSLAASSISKSCPLVVWMEMCGTSNPAGFPHGLL